MMDIRATDRPLEPVALWEIGAASVQAKGEHLVGELVRQMPYMLGEYDPRFAVLESHLRLPSGRQLKVTVSLEVVE